MSDNRQTGKTFRKLLDALARSSSGRQIVYCCQSRRMVDWYFRKAVDVCRTFYLGEDIKITRYKIKFPGGVLLFKTDSDAKLNTALRQFAVVVDQD